MVNVSIISEDLKINIELEEEATSTEMIESFCRMLLCQTYQIGSIINSLEEVRKGLIEESKLAYENSSNE